MDNFKKHCEVIQHLIDVNKVIPQVVNENIMIFRPSETVISETVKEYNLDDKEFRRDLFRDIPKFIIAILSDRVNFLLSFLLNDVDDEEESETKKNEIREKIKIVEECLITDSLKIAYLIKETAKNHLIHDINWEVNEKIETESDVFEKKLRYANVRFNMVQSESGLPFNIPLPIKIDNNSNFVVSLTKEDISYIIMELEELQKVLADEN